MMTMMTMTFTGLHYDASYERLQLTNQQDDDYCFFHDWDTTHKPSDDSGSTWEHTHHAGQL